MKRYILMMVAAIAALGAGAQDAYAPVLEQISRNNPSLRLRQKEYEASVVGNATGLAPENPEVEFGYLWGDKLTGDRKDVSVSQSFDFPTVYSRRNSLSREKNKSASNLLLSQRHDLLLQAKELLVELVYCNAMREMCEVQAGYAQEVLKNYDRLLELGEVNRIDYNKASLNYVSFQNELSRIDVERKRITDELTTLNGGEPVVFDCRQFSGQPLPADFEQWYAEAESKSPELQYLKSEIEVSRRNVSLVKASGLPKLSVGYQGEFVRGSNFQGVTVGVSIPLWENRNKVRQAQAETAVAEEAMAGAGEEYYLTLRSLFERAKALDEMENRYVAGFEKGADFDLLFTAYSKGQLTLLEYVTEVQYLFTMSEKLLETRRDRELAISRLYSFEL